MSWACALVLCFRQVFSFVIKSELKILHALYIERVFNENC